jgi:hypothetical protein
VSDAHTYTVEDGPKMLRETLSVAQSAVWGYPGNGRAQEHADRLQRLLDECERKRPTGNDGKHGSRHTGECGCEDVPETVMAPKEYAVIASKPGASDLLLPCPTPGQAHTLTQTINQDSTDATARVVWRPRTGWTDL